MGGNEDIGAPFYYPGNTVTGKRTETENLTTSTNESDISMTLKSSDSNPKFLFSPKPHRRPDVRMFDHVSCISLLVYVGLMAVRDVTYEPPRQWWHQFLSKLQKRHANSLRNC